MSACFKSKHISYNIELTIHQSILFSLLSLVLGTEPRASLIAGTHSAVTLSPSLKLCYTVLLLSQAILELPILLPLPLEKLGRIAGLHDQGWLTLGYVQSVALAVTVCYSRLPYMVPKHALISQTNPVPRSSLQDRGHSPSLLLPSPQPTDTNSVSTDALMLGVCSRWDVQ